MALFAEIVLPLPLVNTYTYAVPGEMTSVLRQGHRVVVPFGKKKFYTGIVASLSNQPPKEFEPKEIAMLLDQDPILRRPQMQLWEWVAEYYLCSVGEVFRAAIPAGLKVESETFLDLNPDFEEETDNRLSEREAVVIQVLSHTAKRMSVAEIEKATGFTAIGGLISRLLERGAVQVSEKLVERYTSRKVTYVRVNARQGDSPRLHELFDMVGRAKKQEQALLALLDMSGHMRLGGQLREVTQTDLLERTGLTQPVLAAMAKKGIIEIYRKEINRFRHTGIATGTLPTLSQVQQQALTEIHAKWLEKDVTLLHGVTSSGKTEIYIHLIDFVMKQQRQVLYLVPEIALTTQLTRRLQRVFGDKVVIYHSKFTDNERVDIYKKILASTEPMVVIGARSSLFLPFANLGLVIVDEEHETSYKQQDPAPRYNGRDTAMVLARLHGAKTLLGSATPAIDTYFKAQSGRYGLVELTERYSGVALPEVRIVDTTKARKAGEMDGPLARTTVSLIREAVTGDGHGQAIVFLNRRGYAPVAQCKMCAWTPKCEHCDVSLTYHKFINKLVCHYCGTQYPLPVICPACREPSVEIHGYGTERMEDEIAERFEGSKILRMDLDTTRNKDGYESIISEFSAGRADILVGTQMVTKGLDFGNVRVVGIVNTDAIVNQPDFRSSERAFNMIAQVAGRAGRRDSQGIVAVQTREPSHPLFGYVINHDYAGFYAYELEERRRFAYPPFTRLFYIYLKHRDRRTLDDISVAYGRRLRELFGNRVFGPEEPAVGRVQTLYIRKIMLKIEVNASMKKVKEILRATFEEMHASRIDGVRGLIVYYDVDPY